MKKIFMVFIMMGFTTTIVHAGALDNFSQGSRSIGMGAAMTGLADDAAAVYYNPAGLAMLKDDRLQIEAYSSFGFTTSTYAPTGSEFKSEEMSIIPGLLVAKKLDKMGLGLGITIPYGGGGVKFADFPMAGSEFEGALGVMAITPSFAYELMPGFSLGAGLTAYYGTMSNKVDVPFFIPMVGMQLISVEQSYAGIGGFGANFATLIKPTEHLGIGINLRIPSAIKLTGTQTTSGTEEDSEIEFTLPLYINSGLSYQILPELVTTLDLWYMAYENTDKMTFTTGSTVTETETHYKNCINVGFGLEYTVMPNLALRGGFIYSQNGSEDEGLSIGNTDVNKMVLTLGAGYTIDVVTINIAGMISGGAERDYNNTKYDSDSNVITAGVIVAF